MVAGGKWRYFLWALGLAAVAVCTFQKPSNGTRSPTGGLRTVTFSTNGKISARWLSRELSFRKGADLLTLDIERMRLKLEKFQQIRSVHIEKHYPDRLRIRLEERLPLLKVAASVGGKKQLLLVDGMDGEIFRPICYGKDDVEEIPFATFPLVPSGGGSQFVPLAGIAVVREFTVTLRSDFPEIFKSVKFIDLSNYDSRPGALWSTIKLHIAGGIVVAFATENFDLQLLRLDYLLREKCAGNLHRIREINLSPSANVVVEYK
jgi:hypothetical protein